MTYKIAGSAALMRATPDVLPIGNHRASDIYPDAWGWLPGLSLVSALGLLLLAFADTAARGGATWAEPLFWLGLLVLFVPAAIRLASAQATRRERIGLIIVLGMALYLVKVFQNPLAFTYHDELGQLRTAKEILQTQHLFDRNPLDRIYPLYPGLENATIALVRLGGWTLFGAGVIVLAVARFILVVSLFLFIETVSRSARVAGLAVLLYMTNPNFVFFEAQYAYESLALPFAALTLFMLARRQYMVGRSHIGLTFVSLFMIAAVVVTHHLTSYALIIFLVAWTALDGILRKGHWRRERAGPLDPTQFAIVCVVFWLTLVASATISYISPVLDNAVGGFTHLAASGSGAKVPFKNGTGHLDPLWERVTGFASVGVIMLGMPFGLWRIWRRRASALSLVLAAGALGYPGSLALRLTQAGTETSNRASEFLFIGIGFVLALGVAEFWLPRRKWVWKRVVLYAGGAAIMLMGGITVGWASNGRLPGPYLVASGTRSIEAQGIAAAEWSGATLGPNHRVAADDTNTQLFGSYGQQEPESGAINGYLVPELFFSPTFGQAERDIIGGDKIQYLVVDHRLTTALPTDGVYFEKDEATVPHYMAPLNLASLTKFDSVEEISRVFDSGDIVVYDVREIGNRR